MKILYTVIIVFLSLQASAAAPTVPASNLYFAQVDGGYFNLGWTPGNGARRIIICKAGSPVTFIPQNGADYAANTIFGSGQQVATGEFVIYNSPSTSFYVTGLSPATQYYFALFEFNGSGPTAEYLTSSFLTANAATSATPTVQVSNANFTTVTNNSVNFTWTPGNGQRRLVVMREGAPVNADPVNSTQYTVSSVFGTGAAIGTGNYTVYASTGSNTNVTNLKPGTEYFFSFYEFNGNGQPQYKTPAYTSSVTTRSIPTIASTNLVVTKTDGKALSFSWTNGNGQRRIIVAKESGNITGLPADGTDYNANPVFGSGQQLGTGEFVVFDDNFNAATITGLDPNTDYFFKIFEYDGTGANAAYLTASFASINTPTANTPGTQAAGISASNATAHSLNLAFTPGDGRARMIVARQGAAVNVLPTDFTVYTANGNFGSGQDLGNGNFVVQQTTDAYGIVQNLQPNTQYHFAIFEYNGFNQPLYRTPAAVFSATTLAALPVKLVQWEATVINNKVKLQWATSNEINSDQFIVERSSDGIHFTTIATVKAAGNSGSVIHYSIEDGNPLSGHSYYRLKMVDKDGYTEYAAVLTVSVTAKSSVQLLRNPVQQTLNIVNTTTGNSYDTQWQVVSAAGQIMKKGKLQAGNTQVNVSALSAGTYWLQVYSNNMHKTLPFIKQ